MSQLLKWSGSKWRLSPWILNTVRDAGKYNKWVEPFAGSAALFFTLKPEKAVLSDIVDWNIVIFQAIREDPGAVYKEICKLGDDLWERGSEWYYWYRDEYKRLEPVRTLFERAADHMVLTASAFNGLTRFTTAGRWGVAFGKRYCKEFTLTKSFSQKIQNRWDLSELRMYQSLLKRAEIKQQDFTATIKSCTPDDLIYCDPPYLIKSNNIYTKEWSLQTEENLRDILIESGAKFMVSNVSEYMGERNDGLFKTWGQFNFKEIDYTYTINAKQNGAKVKEALIFNF
jgi:DNA adenine methylase